MAHAINYAEGLPLALEVLGSDLHGKDIHQWKKALDNSKRIPHRRIQERISYLLAEMPIRSWPRTRKGLRLAAYLTN